MIFAYRPSQIDSQPLATVDDNLAVLQERLVAVPEIVEEYIDTTSAAVIKYLPGDRLNKARKYYYIKTDISANTVAITPAGTDTIATGYDTLLLQHDFVILTYYKGVWYPLSTNL